MTKSEKYLKLTRAAAFAFGPNQWIPLTTIFDAFYDNYNEALDLEHYYSHICKEYKGVYLLERSENGTSYRITAL